MRQYGRYVQACCDMGNGESAVARMREGKSVVCLVLGQVARQVASGTGPAAARVAVLGSEKMSGYCYGAWRSASLWHSGSI